MQAAGFECLCVCVISGLVRAAELKSDGALEWRWLECEGVQIGRRAAGW